MHTIGLIAAMNLERDALLRQIEGCERTTLGHHPGWQFQLSAKTCNLVVSGMGVRRATLAARSLVENAAPQMLVSFGIAGAVEAELGIGDVVAVEAVCRFEQGACNPLTLLDPWSAADLEAIALALAGYGRRLWTGTAVTTGGSKVSEATLLGLKHPILEMETAGIAHVAADFGIPLRSLRAISDGANAPIPFDLGAVMDEDANLQAGKFLMAVIRSPGVLLQARQVLRNSRIAADHVAIALVAGLTQVID